MDREISSYFDDRQPEYSKDRFSFIIDFINKFAKSNSAVLDIGCGSGMLLKQIYNKSQIRNLYGIDISEKYAFKIKNENIPINIIIGSILDEEIFYKINKDYDYIIMASLLHHLVGFTRASSKIKAMKAISNAFNMLKESGYLIILEPTYYPKLPIDIIFYIKLILTRFTNKRIHLFGTQLNNIGAPLVSYYNDKELKDMLLNIKAKIVAENKKEMKISKFMKYAGIKKAYEVTLISKKNT